MSPYTDAERAAVRKSVGGKSKLSNAQCDAILNRLAAQRERLAALAQAARIARGLWLGDLDGDARVEIQSEERGEDIASDVIAAAIRATPLLAPAAQEPRG